MNRIAFALAFGIGLAAVLWVGAGLLGSSAVALVMTVAIAAAYLLGARELQRFRADTDVLARELGTLAEPPEALDAWLERLPRPLRSAVRLRIEGDRGALPGPALTPYLVGLLVMLGMLGTFLGLIVTFKGAVFAVAGSADLQAVRSALAAPIEGLGLAFGTSVAGVAASAALGLMSALSRRQRQEAGRQLDAAIATVLRPFSEMHRREQTLRAFQTQAEALPGLVERVGALMDELERRGEALDGRLTDGQERFHREAASAYAGLADQVGSALRESLATAARLGGETLRPVVENAMSEIARESRLAQERQTEAARTQLQALATDFDAAERQRLEAWTQSLAATLATLRADWDAMGARAQASHEASAAALERTAQATAASLQQAARVATSSLEGTSRAAADALEHAAHAIAARSSEQATGLLAEVGRLVSASEALVQARTTAEARWTQQHGERLQALEATTVHRLEQLQATAAGLLETLDARSGQRIGELHASIATSLSELQASIGARLTELHATAAGQLGSIESAATARLGALESTAATQLGALETAASTRLAALASAAASQLGALESGAAERFGELNSTVASRLGELDTTVAARLGALQATAAEQLGALQATAAGQLGALETSAARGLEELQSSAAAHLTSLGTALEAPMGRLIEAASEAPKAASELMARLREQMSLLAERDTQALDQHARLVRETGALLDTVRRATEAQREAIETLVNSTASVLAETGQRFAQAAETQAGRFSETVDAQAGRFAQAIDAQAGRATDAADRVAASAADLASLGEAFGRGIELFGSGQQRLAEGLERVEAGIGRAIARSDEQLEYYVAQAREVIELSITAQQGILEDLRRLRDAQGAAAREGA